MSYSHSSILINNREVKISDIRSAEISFATTFEESTLSFLQEWLQGTNTFKLNTSGSTGKPKEITLTREELKQSALRTIAALGLSENNPAIVCLDTKYIAGKMMLVRALEGNMKIIATEPASNPLEKLNSDLTNGFAAFVPLQVQEMMSHADSLHKLNQLKKVIIGGGAVSSSLEAKIKQLSCEVYATYGMTETVSHIALQRLNGHAASEVFMTLPGIVIGKDERGCLVIQVPEFTDTIVTNDLVEIVNSNQFRWLGRFDNVINSGGFKISPEKIEAALETILPGQAFFITSIPDERFGEKLVLLVEGLQPTIDYGKLRLHPYEIPKEVIALPRFIRTETGKVNRKETKLLIHKGH